MGARRCRRQLGAVLWRNVLLKRAAWFSTIFEVAVPVSMMALTVLLKDLSTQFDAPSIAYTCGPARPFDTSVPSLIPLDLACRSQPGSTSLQLENPNHHCANTTTTLNEGFSD